MTQLVQLASPSTRMLYLHFLSTGTPDGLHPYIAFMWMLGIQTPALTALRPLISLSSLPVDDSLFVVLFFLTGLLPGCPGTLFL